MKILLLAVAIIHGELPPLHDFRPREYCSGGICQPVRCSIVQRWVDHFGKPFGGTFPSPDGQCHVCLPASQSFLMCLFLPTPGGM
jgi:hypothetical protein